MTESASSKTIAEMTTEIVSAYVSNNAVEADQVPEIIQAVSQKLAALYSGSPEVDGEKTQPAVSPGRSIGREHIVCLVCGRKQKALKRHLAKSHGLTPDQYRETFGLRPDYPMVAPSTSKRRSEIARSIGLGRRDVETGSDKAA